MPACKSEACESKACEAVNHQPIRDGFTSVTVLSRYHTTHHIRKESPALVIATRPDRHGTLVKNLGVYLATPFPGPGCSSLRVMHGVARERARKGWEGGARGKHQAGWDGPTPGLGCGGEGPGWSSPACRSGGPSPPHTAAPPLRRPPASTPPTNSTRAPPPPDHPPLAPVLPPACT